MKTVSKGQVLKKLALFVCSLIILTGCGPQNTAGSMGSLAGTVSGVPVDVEEKESPGHGPDADLQTDYVDLKKLPVNYSEDMALQDGVVINSLWEVLNTEYLYQFLEMYSQGEDAMVRVMCYTIEGDPIITDISYNNEIITMTVDSSRDKFSSDDKFYTKGFKYLVEKDGLLYLSNHRKWKDNVEDDFYLFANIDDKQIWKNHESVISGGKIIKC